MSRHSCFALPIADNPKKLSIRQTLHHFFTGKVSGRKFHPSRQVSVAVSPDSMAELTSCWLSISLKKVLSFFRAFQEVDVNGSGQIDWYEFAEAILGDDALYRSIQQDFAILNDSMSGN